MGFDTHSPANRFRLTRPLARRFHAVRPIRSLILLAVAGIACAGCHCSAPQRPAAALRVPGTGMVVGRNWGTLPPVRVRNARSWQPMQAVFLSGRVRHNPVYMKDLDHNARFSGNACGFWASSQRELVGVADIPWFYVNLAVCPIMMLERPPFTMETSAAANYRPIYHGQLSAESGSPARNERNDTNVSITKLKAINGKNGENAKNNPQ